MECLIDSNVLIDYVAEQFNTAQLKKLDEIFDSSFAISIITKIETLGYNAHQGDEEKMKLFLSLASVIMLTDEIVQKTIDLKKSVKIKTPDAIIAATALVKGLTIISRNTIDFKKLQGLKVVNPYEF
jgi:predicted nucleic acid-binding protein